MKYDPDKHHRHSIRLADFDYSKTGAYFVTVCTHNRRCLFGDLADGEIVLSPAGSIVEKWWLKLSSKFSLVETDAYVIMPNHFHGIVVMVGADPCVCPHRVADLDQGARMGAPLPKVVQWFKTMTTNEYIRNTNKNSSYPHGLKLWQRNYYEHVIRNERTLNSIREYIQANPDNWAYDPDNPNCREIAGPAFR